MLLFVKEYIAFLVIIYFALIICKWIITECPVLFTTSPPSSFVYNALNFSASNVSKIIGAIM